MPRQLEPTPKQQALVGKLEDELGQETAYELRKATFGCSPWDGRINTWNINRRSVSAYIDLLIRTKRERTGRCQTH